MARKTTREKRIVRHLRARRRIRGTASRPRLSVFRSGRHIHLQLIDDDAGITLAAVSTREIKSSKATENSRGQILGKQLAEKAREKGINTAVFDRGGYKYHGAVKAVAEGAREAGLKI